MTKSVNRLLKFNLLLQFVTNMPYCVIYCVTICYYLLFIVLCGIELGMYFYFVLAIVGGFFPQKKWSGGAPLFLLFFLSYAWVGSYCLSFILAFITLVGEDEAYERSDEEYHMRYCPPVRHDHWESHVLCKDEDQYC